MLRKIKLQNSTLIIIGILVISTGFIIGFYEFFEERKNKTFSEMNILLYENELPENKEQPVLEEKEEINESQHQEDVIIDNKKTEFDYIGYLEIPKINLKAGFLDINSKYNNVDKNVTIIRGSTMPDEKNNNLILAAHSGTCSYCYFNKLYKLKKGDKAYLSYKDIKQKYEIVNIYEEEKDGTVAIYRDYSKKTLTLITCTRNSDTKQTVYILELVK